ncbi:MAG: DNA-binding domain-containing protein [Verrucomicrobia subdivision 3 bacterium]|nr:DNA-binding domain-containing protein [Limisphaerales bacterium]
MNAPHTPPESGEVSRVQRWFQAVVSHPDGVEAGTDSAEAQRLIQLAPGELEKVITRSRALSAAERLAIYANAYHTRLIECVGEVFPMLKRVLGEEAFDGFAFGYLQDYPPRSYTLNELGRHFPRYLQETRPAPDDAQSEPARAVSSNGKPAVVENWPDFLIDLARLEWAIYEVFDGPGVEGQTLLHAADLLDVSPERWPQAQLQPVPCLQLLTTRFPVNDYYTALRKAKPDEAVPIPLPGESFVALTRRQFIVRRYNLSRTEFELLRAIKEELTIGQAIERAALTAKVEVDQLAADLKLWFRNWTAEGFFQAAHISR